MHAVHSPVGPAADARHCRDAAQLSRDFALAVLWLTTFEVVCACVWRLHRVWQRMAGVVVVFVAAAVVVAAAAAAVVPIVCASAAVLQIPSQPFLQCRFNNTRKHTRTNTDTYANIHASTNTRAHTHTHVYTPPTSQAINFCI